VHELPYDPVRRFIALSKVGALDSRRGAKTTEHLAVLRLSDPCYGSLMPAKERAAVHELPYDPVRRFSALSKVGALECPRGDKPFEHLRNLRLSDPSMGSLSPSTRAALDDDDEEEEDVIADDEEEYLVARPRPLSTRTSGSLSAIGRLPRILSNQAFEPLEDDDEALSPLSDIRHAREPPTWCPPMGARNPAFYSEGPSYGALGLARHARLSHDGSERDSLRSDARTALERTSERSSNDTIASFLDDHDPTASQEWTAADFRAQLKAELGDAMASPGASPVRRVAHAGSKKGVPTAGKFWGSRKATEEGTSSGAPPVPEHVA